MIQELIKTLILKNKVRNSLAVLMIGIFFGGYEFYDFQTGVANQMSAEVVQVESQINELRSEVDRVKRFAENIPAVKQAFREQSLQLESVLESIPRTTDLTGLLRKFTLLAQGTGVELVSFKPENKEDATGFFKSTSVELNIRGAFIPTLVFFDQVSKLKRVVTFDVIRLSAIKNPLNTRPGAPLVSDTFAKLKTYRLSDS